MPPGSLVFPQPEGNLQHIISRDTVNPLKQFQLHAGQYRQPIGVGHFHDQFAAMHGGRTAHLVDPLTEETSPDALKTPDYPLIVKRRPLV